MYGHRCLLGIKFLEVHFGLGKSGTAQELNIDRTARVHAGTLSSPDVQNIIKPTGAEQLNTAQLHQFGISGALAHLLSLGGLAKDISNGWNILLWRRNSKPCQTLLLRHFSLRTPTSSAAKSCYSPHASQSKPSGCHRRPGVRYTDRNAPPPRSKPFPWIGTQAKDERDPPGINNISRQQASEYSQATPCKASEMLESQRSAEERPNS